MGRYKHKKKHKHKDQFFVPFSYASAYAYVRPFSLDVKSFAFAAASSENQVLGATWANKLTIKHF